MASTYISLPALTLTSPVVVTGTVAVTQSTSPWIISGAVTGPLTDAELRNSAVLVNGTVVVSNIPALNAKNDILAAPDTVATVTWLDFGVSTQRVSTIAYHSATIQSSLTATKTFAYTNVGGSYRLDTVTWSVA